MLLRILDRLEEVLIGLCMAVATLLIFFAVVQRYGMTSAINLSNWGRAHEMAWLQSSGRSVFFFMKTVNLTWAQELCIFLFVWMAKFGAAYGVRQGIHVGVDVLVNLVGEKARRPVIIFALLSGVLFTFTIGTFGAVFVTNMAGTDQTSPDLELPMWLVYLAIPAGSYLMCFRFLQVTWIYVRTGEIVGHSHAQVTVPGIGIGDDLPATGLSPAIQGAAR